MPSPASGPAEAAVATAAAAPRDPVDTGRPGHCQPFAAWIGSKLALGLIAQRIYQDLKSEVAFSGSYQSVKRFARRLKRSEP